MFARTPTAIRSPVLALALALVLLLTQQFGLQHGVSHLRGGPVDRWSTAAPGSAPGSATDSATDSTAGSAADATSDSTTDTLCPVCLVLAAIGAATLLGVLRWLLTLQASGAPTAPARRTPVRRARRQHHARAPPAVFALT